MAEAVARWIGLEFAEEIDGEALKQKLRRDARIDLWGRGVLAVGWVGLAIFGILTRDSEDTVVVFVLWPTIGLTAVALFFIRLRQISNVLLANKYKRKGELLSNKLTLSVKGDGDITIGEPEDYYWTYTESVEVGEQAVELIFKDRRRSKRLLIPRDVFPDADTLESFRKFVEAEAGKAGLSSKENWLRPPN